MQNPIHAQKSPGYLAQAQKYATIGATLKKGERNSH
jgi:hypothetical protein